MMVMIYFLWVLSNIGASCRICIMGWVLTKVHATTGDPPPSPISLHILLLCHRFCTLLCEWALDKMLPFCSHPAVCVLQSFTQKPLTFSHPLLVCVGVKILMTSECMDASFLVQWLKCKFRKVLRDWSVCFLQYLFNSCIIFLQVGGIHINKWKLDKKLGIYVLVLYAVFLCFSILIEFNVFTFVNFPMCREDDWKKPPSDVIYIVVL